MARQLDKQRNHRYDGQGRHDEAMRLKVQQLYASPSLARPKQHGKTNELNSTKQSQAGRNGESYSMRAGFNETTHSVFRKRTEHINNTDVNDAVVLKARTTAGFGSSSSGIPREGFIASRRKGSQGSETNITNDLTGNELNNHERKYYEKDFGLRENHSKDFVYSHTERNFEKTGQRPSNKKHGSVDDTSKNKSDDFKTINTSRKPDIYSEESKNFSRLDSSFRNYFGQFDGQKTGNLKLQENSRIRKEITDEKEFSHEPKDENMNDDKRNKIRVQEKIVTIRRKSVDILQDNDPNAVVTPRKLSQVSQDLMKSKEELINRSKQCGIMLQQYKKREEEKRETVRPNERANHSQIRGKHSSQGSFDDKAESEYSYDGDNIRVSQTDNRNSLTDISQSSQSPRIAKRKSSYIDSWLQSQQSRISTLVSAIKEDPDEDTGEEHSRNSDLQRRDRSASVPPDSSLFLSWGRSDDSSFDGDDPTRVSHTRTSSGDEIGLSGNSPRFVMHTRSSSRESSVDSPRLYGRIHVRTSSNEESLGLSRNSPRLVMNTRSNSRESPVDSPRLQEKMNQSNCYPTADELRSIARQSMNMRRRRDVTAREISDTKQIQDGSRNNNASIKNERFVKIEQNFEEKSPNSQIKLKKETTFDADVTTNIVPADIILSQRTSVSPRNNTTPRPSSSPKATATNTSLLPWQQEIEKEDTTSIMTSSESSMATTPPFSNGRILQERHGNMEGNRHHPVAVVKPLQHVKSQSFDGTYSESGFYDMRKMRGDLSVSRNSIQSTNLDDLINHQKPGTRNTEFAPSQRPVLKSYNVQLDNPTASQLTNDSASLSPRDYEFNKLSPSQKNEATYNSKKSTPKKETDFSIDHNISSSFEFHENPVDVEEHVSDVSASSERAVDVGPEIAPVSSPTFITQEFQWYSAKSKNTYEKAGSLPQDSTQGKLERLGRFKRGSKLLESKVYSSFSKSLENLSKIGKDYIKSKKNNKSPKEKSDTAEKRGKGKKESETAGKARIVGDLELNEEFARNMERKSRRFSMDASKIRNNYDELEKRPKSMWVETSQEVKARPDIRMETSFDENMGARPKVLDENMGTRPKVFDENMGRRPRVFDENMGARPRVFVDTRKSDVTEKEFHSADNEGFRDNNRINPDFESVNRNSIDLSVDKDIENTLTSERRISNDVNGAREIITPERGRQKVTGKQGLSFEGSDANSRDFIDDDDNDDDEKEMVQIARKISTLRSSQYKIKRDKGDNVTSDNVTSNNLTSDVMTSDNVTSDIMTSEVATSDEITSQQLMSDNAMAGNFSSDTMTSDNVTSGNMTSIQRRRELDETEQAKEVDVTSSVEHKEPAARNDDNGAVKRISTSLSRVMTDLRELREQDMTLASQLLGLGKSIKHFKKQKKEMENFYAMLEEDDDDGDSSEMSDSSDDEY